MVLVPSGAKEGSVTERGLVHGRPIEAVDLACDDKRGVGVVQVTAPRDGVHLHEFSEHAARNESNLKGVVSAAERDVSRRRKWSSSGRGTPQEGGQGVTPFEQAGRELLVLLHVLHAELLPVDRAAKDSVEDLCDVFPSLRARERQEASLRS